MTDFGTLDSDLPEPKDDGRANGIKGKDFPKLTLKLASGGEIDTNEFYRGTAVVYCYPITGTLEKPYPTEDWKQIPGACGCTPQAVSYNVLYSEFQKMYVRIFGLSTQKPNYQNEMRNRMGINFDIISDSDFVLKEALNLPVFKAEDMVLLSRLTMIIKDGKIVKVFYPVFPPDKDASEVLKWIKTIN